MKDHGQDQNVRDHTTVRRRRIGIVVLGAAIAILLSFSGVALATTPAGLLMEPLARGAIGQRIRVNTDNVTLKTKGRVDIFTQRITIQPNGHTGWHSHPGPVLVALEQGTVISYESNCRPKAYSAGQGFVDPSNRVHIMRNMGTEPAVLYITALLPPGTPLRTDERAPATCFAGGS